MEYAINNKDNYFIKEETDGIYTILIKDLGVQFHINKTGKMIYDLLCEMHQTENVLAKLETIFPKVHKKVLASDFEDVFNLLVLYGMIKVDENEKDSNYTENPTIKYAGDGDYRKLTKFITNKSKQSKFSFNGLTNTKDINPISLRYTTFHGIRHFCIATDESDELLACIVVIPPAQASTVVGIDGIIVSKDIKEEEAIVLCNKMLKVINRGFHDKITKFRFSIFSDFNNLLVLNYMKKLEFVKETELLYESGNKSLIMYTKFQEEKY